MPRERFFLELEPPTEALRGRPHVVIVGGGFAGLAACKALAGADLRVTLIDKRNYNLLQPLLYQVSTGLVAPGDVTVPLRLLLAMEEAEQTPEAGKRRLLQSVVVVGGGPTGCELAGSVSELLRHALARDFRQLEPGDTRILLVDPGDRLLRGMHPDLGAGARRFLESIGVEVLLGGLVKAI